MASDFVIQVVYRTTGQVVEWAPGQQVERDFVNELATRVAAKGVGVTRTTTHVVNDVKAALRELFFDLKSDVPPQVA